MARSSAFFSDNTKSLRPEFRFYVAFGVMLALAGLSVLSIPIINRGGIAAFIASWLLFIAAILALLRPALYGRGLPDMVAALITAFYYGFVGYIAGGENLLAMDGYRLAICAVLLFAGVARLLVFARMLSAAALPMELVCCVADITVAILLVQGIPGDGTITLYWYTGMLTLIDAAESLSEAEVLSRRARMLSAQRT